MIDLQYVFSFAFISGESLGRCHFFKWNIWNCSIWSTTCYLWYPKWPWKCKLVEPYFSWFLFSCCQKVRCIHRPLLLSSSLEGLMFVITFGGINLLSYFFFSLNNLISYDNILVWVNGPRNIIVQQHLKVRLDLMLHSLGFQYLRVRKMVVSQCWHVPFIST